jgi:hypothetical protein
MRTYGLTFDPTPDERRPAREPSLARVKDANDNQPIIESVRHLLMTPKGKRRANVA